MWVRYDDKLHDHRKIRDLLEEHEDDPLEALAAVGMWTLAGTWSADQLADGAIRETVLRRWAQEHAPRLADHLISVGLLDPPTLDERDRRTHQIHDFLDYNDSRAKILADQEAARIRKALYADPELVDAIIARDGDRCRYCGTRVKRSDRRSDAGGTFDHVKPIVRGGRNTLDNVVTACRRCNTKKGGRTLAEAGMTKLPPRSMGAPLLDDPADRPTSDDDLVLAGSGRDGSGRVGARSRPSSTRTKSKETR